MLESILFPHYCCNLVYRFGNIDCPDEILLEIFKLYIAEHVDEEGWEMLVHMCQRWRYVTFAAPRCLGLQIICTAKTQARTMLDVWPALPILIWVVNVKVQYLKVRLALKV